MLFIVSLTSVCAYIVASISALFVYGMMFAVLDRIHVSLKLLFYFNLHYKFMCSLIASFHVVPNMPVFFK